MRDANDTAQAAATLVAASRRDEAFNRLRALRIDDPAAATARDEYAAAVDVMNQR